MKYLLLLFAGWANIYSAAYDPEHPNLSIRSEYGNQSVWIVVCLVLGSALLMVRGDFIKDIALPAYGFVLLLLMLVPLIGTEIGGDRTGWPSAASVSSPANSPSSRQRWCSHAT